MVTTGCVNSSPQTPIPSAQRRGLVVRMLEAALQSFNARFDEFSSRLVDALMKVSENVADSKQANLHFNAGNLLTNNRYVFFHLTPARMEQMQRDAYAALEQGSLPDMTSHAGDLALVPFAEMDN